QTHCCYQSDAVDEGVAAREYIHRHLYDDLVTDLVLPVLDGLGLVEWLRRAGDTGLPVLIITSRASVEDRARARDLDVRHILDKPISAEVLLAALAFAPPA